MPGVRALGEGLGDPKAGHQGQRETGSRSPPRALRGYQAKGWDEAKGIISKLAAEAEDNDVVLGFEGGLWANSGLGGLKELCRMVDEVGSRSLGVYEHCYWPRGNMRPHEEIELVGNRIVGLHSGRIDAKNVDYEAMLKALKGRYDRYWVLEIDREDVKESLDSLKGILRRYW